MGAISRPCFTIAAGTTETFDILYSPDADGAFSFDLDITSDDVNEGNYDISVSGTAVVATAATVPAPTTDSEPSPPPVNPGVFGGEKITPSSYRVTIAKIEFKNAQGDYVTVAEGGTQFDVASVGANSSLGSFGKATDLPVGTYTEMRITLSNNFEINASGSDKGSTCSTSSSGSSGSVSSSLTNGSTGSSAGETATTQQVSYPTGSAASSALSAAGISESGNGLQISTPVSFTIESGGSVPSIAINIDVTDTVEVLTSGGSCFILPQPPSMNVVVGS